MFMFLFFMFLLLSFLSFFDISIYREKRKGLIMELELFVRAFEIVVLFAVLCMFLNDNLKTANRKKRRQDLQRELQLHDNADQFVVFEDSYTAKKLLNRKGVYL